MRNERTGHSRGVSFLGLLASGIALTVLMFVLVRLERNVPYTPKPRLFGILSMSKGTQPEKTASALLVCEDDAMGEKALTMMRSILAQSRTAYDTAACCDVTPEMLNGYRTLILGVTHYRQLAQVLPSLRDWVRAGGDLMILYPPEADGSFLTLSNLIGTKDIGQEFAVIEGLRFDGDLMIGAAGRTFRITDPYESSLVAALESDCEVLAQSDAEYPVPVIWRRQVGEGTVVFDNLGFMEKAYRGIHSAAYSLLGDYSLRPVINAAAFYIDDFPAPVPGGTSPYIARDYDMDIREFYTSVWWRDVYNLAEKYGIRYTGLVIENYTDRVEAPFSRNADTDQYRYFGNMLLEQGGEIGLHGYNHMPLVPESFDYRGEYDNYVRWPSQDDMRSAVSEVRAFTENLFPYSDIKVYVPPSNILSQEGLDVLYEQGIGAVASVYLPGDLAYSQEFDVDDRGMINTPRIVSGYVLDDYMQLAALSELNYQLVSSHFQHPDDVLDAERGAAMGWEEMYGRLSRYADWLYRAVPQIRSLTGTEFAGAVQRYDAVDMVHRETEGGIEIELTDFYDQAWFVLRDNRGRTVASVEGGEFTELGGDQILIRADRADLRILFE